jgi:hypothetical protein
MTWRCAAPSALDGIDAIVAEGPYYKQKADELQREVERQTREKEAAQTAKRLSQRERDELARLKADDQQRKQKKLHKQRSTENRRARQK